MVYIPGSSKRVDHILIVCSALQLVTISSAFYEDLSQILRHCYGPKFIMFIDSFSSNKIKNQISNHLFIHF